jgi:HD-like signal output (HDOD) protein
MGDELAEKISENIRTLPSLPITVAKVLEICNNPKTSPADLNRVISLDPVLVGRVLRLINSAYYGMEQRVTSLVRAIIMLGLNTVKNLALSTAVMKNLSPRKNSQGFNMDRFWQHSICVGVAAKLIALRRGIDIKQCEDYFTAGLLHDIGKIPLNAVLAGDYMLTVGIADQERISLWKAEDRNLGINHCAVGGMITQSWKLGGMVEDIITRHHTYSDYEGPYKDILYTVVLANLFASEAVIGFSGDWHPENPPQKVWTYLKVKQDFFNEIKPLVNGEIEKASVFLRL